MNNLRPLVVTGFQVVVMGDGKEEKVGRVSHVKDAAEALAELCRKRGDDAVVRSVLKFEGESKAVK